LLALLFGEPGGETLTADFMAESAMSTVNLAEVQGNLVNRGLDAQDAWEETRAYLSSIEPFTAEQAKVAGSLVQQTRSLGLSLGDLACLALGIILKAPVYTADHAWKDLQIGCPVHLIR
jgi:PIN domain nuclease of toxin-antitoxin system